ncbi:GNAT family N-acetyltransferase [Puniceicoccales bacterium CK1056]|uniref:GNAT family N-acetyltransferase n=1 Tax=Oceanipulchritudo coccoides TaxID=2706888 RepID=A0A6B2LZ88_9BACT|nr:GNAT family N-acetyltransferase [Oceanipulchritudo coccoides]NDV62031.1 GNAT family N-acetyltransferase [Oceanipulchritudo coccoides]
MDPIISISHDLVLKVLRPCEAGVLFSLVQKNRAHLREWLPWVDSTRSPVDTRKFLEMSYGGFLHGAGFNFGIRHHGGLVGLVGFHGFDMANRITSLGYWLSEDACGKGIMREAVAGCVQYAFSDRGMNRVYVRCATNNFRSKRIPESLGFTHEGTQREAEWLYDHFVDLDVYSVLAAEWDGSIAT